MALSKLAAGTTGLKSLAGMVDAADNLTLFGASTGAQGNTLFGYTIKQIDFIRGTFRVVHAWTGKSTWHVNLVVGFTLVGNSHRPAAVHRPWPEPRRRKNAASRARKSGANGFAVLR
jgi:hypothetical protein